MQKKLDDKCRLKIYDMREHDNICWNSLGTPWVHVAYHDKSQTKYAHVVSLKDFAKFENLLPVSLKEVTQNDVNF